MNFRKIFSKKNKEIELSKRLLGFYKEITNFDDRLVSVEEIQRRKTTRNNKKAVQYLKNGYLLFTSKDRQSYIDDGLIPINDVYTDGEWLWTAYYIYFAELELEKIPKLFVNKMKSQRFKAPKKNEISKEQFDLMSKAYSDKEYLPKEKNEKPRWKEYLVALENGYDRGEHEFCLEVSEILLPMLQNAKNVEPKDWRNYYFFTARHNLNLKRVENVEELLNKALTFKIENELENISINFALGDYYQIKNDTKNAVKAYKNIIQVIEKTDINSEDLQTALTTAYFRIGGTYKTGRQYEKAVSTWEKYLSIYKQYFSVNIMNKQYHFAYVYTQKLKTFLELEKQNFPTYIVSVQLDELGNVDISDKDYAKWWISRLPNPSNESLQQNLEKSTKVEILEIIYQEKDFTTPINRVKYKGKETVGAKIIFTETEKSKVHDLVKLLEISQNDEYGHVMEKAGMTLRFYDANNEIIEIQFLNRDFIRWESTWKNDGRVKKPEKLMKWFENNNIKVIEKTGKIEFM